MSSSSSRRFPVTVTQLPVTRCEICQRTVTYRPGTLTEALTENYRRPIPKRSAFPRSKVRSPPHHPPASTVTDGNCPEPRAPADIECGPLFGESPRAYPRSARIVPLLPFSG